MYITLSNIGNGNFIPLDPAIDTQEDLEIALSEILYYPIWSNFSASLGNNKFSYKDVEVIIPDGYYDICALDDQIFAPLKLAIKINLATGLVSIYHIKLNFDLGSVGPTLGFENLTPNVVEGICTAEKLPKLIVYKELFVHLEGVSTKENRLN